MEGVSDSLTIGPLEVVRQVRVQTARRHCTVCVAHTGGLSLVALWDVLVHNFSPFDIQHTKSPKNPPRTHALDCMGKVSKLPGLNTVCFDKRITLNRRVVGSSHLGSA